MMAMSPNTMREIKLCLLGDSGVGKSCLVLRFVADRFEQHSTATIGASFMSKTFSLGEQTFKYQIWDTAGQEKYKALAPMYYRGAAAAIVVYDITSDSSFGSVKRWVKELEQLGPPDIVIAVAGNKMDLKDQREVSIKTGEEYAESIGAVFKEVSALTAHNVNEIFEEISKNLPPEKEIIRKPSLGFPEKKPVEKSKCC